MRYVQLDTRYIYGPKFQLDNGFKGLDIQYTELCYNRNIDGRALYEIVIGANSAYSDDDLLAYKEIVLEGLSLFSCHLKTVNSAKVLADSISGFSWSIDGDAIVSPHAD